MNTRVTANMDVPGLWADKPHTWPIVLELLDDIDTATIRTVANTVSRAVQRRQSLLPVVIHSQGGDVYAALHVAELLKASGLEIHTVLMGVAASCAAVIFTCGRVRWISPLGRLMVHDVSADLDGNLTGLSMLTEAGEMQTLKDALCRIMSLNIGKAEDYFARLLQTRGNVDVYLGAEECLAEGIATRIGTPHVQVDVHVTVDLVDSALKPQTPTRPRRHVPHPGRANCVHNQ